MAEKETPGRQPQVHAPRQLAQNDGTSKNLKNRIILLLTAVILLCLHAHWRLPRFVPVLKPDMAKGIGEESRKQVDVELFVMSKCPDAVKCESVFGTVLKHVYPITSINTTYIVSEDTGATYGATCKHGTDECLGNIHQLCIRDAYPEPYHWYKYILCVNERYSSIPNERQARACAESVGVDWELVQQCATSEKGPELLIESARRVATVGTRTSCTIYINGVKRCVHDGGWLEDQCPGGHEVDDFVRDIRDAYVGSESFEKSRSLVV